MAGSHLNLDNVIDLKAAVLNYKPGLRKHREHALIVYLYIEECEKDIDKSKLVQYNDIQMGDLAVL